MEKTLVALTKFRTCKYRRCDKSLRWDD